MYCKRAHKAAGCYSNKFNIAIYVNNMQFFSAVVTTLGVRVQKSKSDRNNMVYVVKLKRGAKYFLVSLRVKNTGGTMK